KLAQRQYEGLALRSEQRSASGHLPAFGLRQYPPLTWWLQNASDTATHLVSSPSSAVAGCSGLGNHNSWTLNDLPNIPPPHPYGPSTSGTAYTNSTVAYNGTTMTPHSRPAPIRSAWPPGMPWTTWRTPSARKPS